jgi:DNA-binding LacI/PurR family transcriptional regulator
MERPTIGDVANEAGYSKATVSAVLNDVDTVKESTRRKINRVIDELNYRPRAAAQKGFRGNGNKSVGVIIKEEGNPYYSDVIAGVRSYVKKKGYTPVVASSEGKYKSEQQVVELFKRKDVDGLIIIPVVNDATDLSYLFELKRRNFPFVVLVDIQGIQASLVDIDNVEATKMAASHLVENGHQHIVHFAGPEYSMHSEERIRGIREAFSESPMAFSDDLIVRAGAYLQDGYEVGKSYFQHIDADERPSAVLCYNDLIAIGLMRALRELEISVPEEVSLIGCDNIKFAKYMSVPLTSIHIPKYEMGHRAAEILLDQIESEEKVDPQQDYLQAELVKRASSRPLEGVST